MLLALFRAQLPYYEMVYVEMDRPVCKRSQFEGQAATLHAALFCLCCFAALPQSTRASFFLNNTSRVAARAASNVFMMDEDDDIELVADGNEPQQSATRSDGGDSGTPDADRTFSTISTPPEEELRAQLDRPPPMTQPAGLKKGTWANLRKPRGHVDSKFNLIVVVRRQT
jgi:hypothetical protein